MTETVRVDLAYEPRPHQWEAHERRKRFSVLVWHRRSGKTVFSVMELLLAAVAADPDRRGRYAYIAPFYRQAKAVAWDYLKHYARHVPGVEVREAELAVRFPNGAEIRLFGADNPDSLRGLYFDGVVLDEVADMRSEVWGEILRPALTDREGWALFIGTPKGVNLFSELYQRALNDEDWYADLRRASETGAITAEELARAKHEMSPSQYAQEMECDFSAAVDNALINLDAAIAAAQRDAPERMFSQFPKVIGVDVARYGDDRSVVARRQGPVAFTLEAFRHMDLMALAGQVARIATDWKPDAIFVDEGGVGAGVVDRLAQLGYRPIGVSFGGKPTDDRYENKRMEMWQAMADWLGAGCIPNDHELIRELTAPLYTYANARGRKQLESKDDLRERLKCSPDKADALALTFAMPVEIPQRDALGRVERRQAAHPKTWSEKERRI